MLKKGLVRLPTMRSGHEAEVERHASWLELFYDLVFVAAVSQLATSLTDDYSAVGFIKFSALFVPVWWAWVGHTFYLSRFDSDDVVHRVLAMVQMAAAASLAVHASDALGTTSAGFALSYAAARFVLVAEYLRAGYHLPQARPLTNRFSRGFGIAAALWVLSVFVPPPLRFWIWAGALAIDFLTPVTAGQLHIKFPPHLTHLPERFGLFTIIVIGEAVVSVVIGIGKTGLTIVSGAAGFMGLIVAFTLWWGYFEGAKGASARLLSSREHIRRYQQWLYAHLPLVIGITATAVGVKHVILLHPSESLPLEEAWMLCCSVGISVLAMNAIFIAAFPAAYARAVRRFTAPYYVIAFLGVATGTLGDVLPGLVILAILTALCIAQIYFSLREAPESPV